MVRKITSKDGDEFEAFDEFKGMDDERSDDVIIEKINDEIEFEEEKEKSIEKLRDIWNSSDIYKGYTPRGSNKEEMNKKKLDTLWKLGKVIAEFYKKFGYERRQCPECGYWNSMVHDFCGQGREIGSNEWDKDAISDLEDELNAQLNKSDFQKGCGYQFDESIQKSNYHTNQSELEKTASKEIDGIHDKKGLSYFKQFYWMFPDKDYEIEVSWAVHFDMASFYNFPREIWWDDYQQIKENLKNGGNYKKITRGSMRMARFRHMLNPKEAYE